MKRLIMQLHSRSQHLLLRHRRKPLPNMIPTTPRVARNHPLSLKARHRPRTSRACARCKAALPCR
jgi:hypothetical protein